MADDDGSGRVVSLASQPALDLVDGACGRAGGMVVAMLVAAVPPRDGLADGLLGKQEQQRAPEPDDGHQKQHGTVRTQHHRVAPSPDSNGGDTPAVC
jgi:hypothetical protein